MDKAIKEAHKLDDEILDMRLKLARLEKQRRFWLKRLKDLGDKETANILEIEESVMAEDSLPESVSDFPVAIPDFSDGQLDSYFSSVSAGANLGGVSHS